MKTSICLFVMVVVFSADVSAGFIQTQNIVNLPFIGYPSQLERGEIDMLTYKDGTIQQRRQISNGSLDFASDMQFDGIWKDQSVATSEQFTIDGFTEEKTTFGSGSAESSVNLETGEIKTKTVLNHIYNYANASSFASMSEQIFFSANEMNAGTATIFLNIDGTMTGNSAFSYRLDLSTRYGGWSFYTDTFFKNRVNDLLSFELELTDIDDFITIDFRATTSVRGAGSADFGNTSWLNLDFSDSRSFTSQSGVFLTTPRQNIGTNVSSVSEPSTLALLGCVFIFLITQNGISMIRVLRVKFTRM